MKNYEFTEQEARFIKFALISLQRDVSAELLRNYPSKKLNYLLISDRLNACNCLIDKLNNWGI